MLLRFFEERIAVGKTPGQLLLFDEPESHLHPQLQRVLFKTLLDKSFQTIATTHSTHITSQVKLHHIVVLTDDGTPATASTVPTAKTNLTDQQIADLERYLDATRGTLLYARKVILVEGPAELFLIPPLVKKVMGVDLDENGISIIPIFGVHFGVYAKLFGPNGVTKKCAIIADGDLKPSDAIDITERDPKELPPLVPPSLHDLENNFVKVFLCNTTFEREITDNVTILMLAETARELGANKVSENLESLILKEHDITTLNKVRDLVLATAKRFGKARFTQVASRHVGLAQTVPEYIKNAIEWLLQNDSE